MGEGLSEKIKNCDIITSSVYVETSISSKVLRGRKLCIRHRLTCVASIAPHKPEILPPRMFDGRDPGISLKGWKCFPFLYTYFSIETPAL